jgi:P27 family predicted phage terminase small subunit
MPGPARLPTCLKDPAVSKQAANPAEPKPAALPAPPSPPSNLSEVGALIWADLAATLHATNPALLTMQDLPVFRMLVESLELYARAQKKIDDEGPTKYAGRTGRTYANPAIAVRAAAVQEVMKLSAFFGLTPSHRAAMHAGGNGKRAPGERGPEANRRIR